jgi:RNA polymerase sigma-70 factor, ECF subfamily
MPEKILTENYFNELFNLYYEELCRIVFPILKDKDAAEDVVQDVFVKTWLRKEDLIVNTTFKAYLYRAVVFKALDYLRKQRNSQVVKDELKIIHNQSHQNTDSALEEKELIKAIEMGMEKMPENMRTIFHLSRFTDLKNKEIAEQLNISIKTVESNITKALKLLSDYLRPYIKNQNLKTTFLVGLIYLLKSIG